MTLLGFELYDLDSNSYFILVERTGIGGAVIQNGKRKAYESAKSCRAAVGNKTEESS